MLHLESDMTKNKRSPQRQQIQYNTWSRLAVENEEQYSIKAKNHRRPSENIPTETMKVDFLACSNVATKFRSAYGSIVY